VFVFSPPFRNLDFFKSCAGEFVGSLLLLYITSSAILTGGLGNALDTAWAFGAAMLVLVYAFSGISGGHLNPAVSFGHMIAKNITMVRAVSYTVCQCLGACLGASFAKNLDSVTDAQTWNSVADGIGNGTAFWAEVMGTFVLMWVVLAATDSHRSEKSAHLGPLAPLSIGMAYFVLHIGMLHIDGCSVNPARSFGAANASNEWGDHWVFWLGPLLGATLSGIAYGAFSEDPKVQHGDVVEVEKEKEDEATTLC
jgi:aquaporin PIP